MTEREDRSWGQAKRFEFLEWRLFWVGRLNRRDLEQQFGISTPQASIDLRNYQEAAEGNLAYDATLKAYVRGQNFLPRFLRVSGDRYLLQMRALHMGAIDLADTWFSDAPCADTLPQLSRKVKDEDIRTVVSAITSKTDLSINYRSFSGTKFRNIAPHCLAYDGHRWHIRAWCYEHSDFRDFLLTRISEPEIGQRSLADATADLVWHRSATLVICPHPDLTEEQRETIELDFGMSQGKVEINMRLALAFYFIARNDLDKPHADPLRQQIILQNIDEVREAVTIAENESKGLVAWTEPAN